MTANTARARDNVQVTVRTAAHNCAVFLGRSIMSAVMQTLPGIGSLMGKIASPDPTPSVAEVLAANAPRVSVLDLPATGDERGVAIPVEGPAILSISSLPVCFQSFPARLYAILARNDRPAGIMLNCRQTQPAGTLKQRVCCIAIPIESATTRLPTCHDETGVSGKPCCPKELGGGAQLAGPANPMTYSIQLTSYDRFVTYIQCGTAPVRSVVAALLAGAKLRAA